MSIPCRILNSGRCEITDTFDLPRHGGVDLVDEGFKFGYVVAHSEGEVIQVRKDCTGYEPNGSYGNFVKIKHKNGYYTLYAHLCYDTIPVNVGDKVKKEEYIGFMGATGYVTAGHLHFEVRNTSDTRIDPEPYLDNDLPNMIEITPNVERDVTKNQVEVLEPDLHVRLLPSLNGDILGVANKGYYNVLEVTENDDYKWFKIADNNYIAYSEDWAKYYPNEEVDYKKLYMDSLKQIEELEDKIKKAIEDLS